METKDHDNTELKEHISNLQKQIAHLTSIVQKQPMKGNRGKRGKAIDARKDAIIELVKSYPNGVPIEEFYNQAEKAGYINKKGAGVYFKQESGLLLIAALPNGEKRVFFNPKQYHHVADT